MLSRAPRFCLYTRAYHAALRERWMKPRKKRSRSNGALPFVDPIFADAMVPHRARAASRDGREGKPDHKAMQVCRAAQRALSLALGGECDDDVLRSLYVESVLPAPDASRLLVCVVVPRDAAATTEDVLARLARVHGLLRSAVARTVTRRRAPELSFLPTREFEAPEVTP
jgi:ribosome-binding factor A